MTKYSGFSCYALKALKKKPYRNLINIEFSEIDQCVGAGQFKYFVLYCTFTQNLKINEMWRTFSLIHHSLLSSKHVITTIETFLGIPQKVRSSFNYRRHARVSVRKADEKSRAWYRTTLCDLWSVEADDDEVVLDGDDFGLCLFKRRSSHYLNCYVCFV